MVVDLQKLALLPSKTTAFASRMVGDLSSGESANCQRSQDRPSWPHNGTQSFGNKPSFGILRERKPQLLLQARSGQTAELKSVCVSTSLFHVDNFVESHHICQSMALHCQNGEPNDSQERREPQPDYVVSELGTGATLADSAAEYNNQNTYSDNH